MLRQLLTPVAGALPLSFIIAALPVAVVFVLLGVMRRPVLGAVTSLPSTALGAMVGRQLRFVALNGL